MQVNAVSLNNVEAFGSRKKRDFGYNDVSKGGFIPAATKVLDDLPNASDEDLARLA